MKIVILLILLVFSFSLPLHSTDEIILATINDKTFVTLSDFRNELEKVSPSIREKIREKQKIDMLNAFITRLLVEKEVKTLPIPNSPIFQGHLSQLRRKNILSSFILNFKKLNQANDETKISSFYKKHGEILYPNEELSKCKSKIIEKLTNKNIEKKLDQLYKEFLIKNEVTTGEVSLFFSKYFKNPEEKLNEKPIYKFDKYPNIKFVDFYGMITFLLQKGSKIDIDNPNHRNYLLEKILKDSIMKYIAINIEKKLPNNLPQLEDTLRNSWYLSKNMKKIKIEDKEIEDFYKQNEIFFNIKPKVNIDLIEVKNEKTGKKVLLKLKNGQDFNKLVEEFSIHKSKKNGGHIGWVNPNISSMEYLWIPFMKLKNNEVSDLIKTKNGFFIVKLIKKIDGKKISLQAAYKKIKFILSKQRESLERNRFTEKLIKKYNVKVFNKKLKDISFK